MNDKVRATLNSILERFKSGNIPEAIAYSLFPIPNIPSAKWSLINRTLMFLAGTQDARGFKQWLDVNRYVRRGAKAFFILVPYLKKVEDEDTGEEKQVLKGFLTKPVFRVEDTGGEALDYQKIELPRFSLIEKAEEWGIPVKAIPGNYGYYGYFSLKRREIALATPEERTFFHELAHAGHEMLRNGLEPGQDPFQEIVAELSALALCRLVGKTGDKFFGNSYRYIEQYAQELKISPYSACLRVIGETEKVLNLILGKEETQVVSSPL
ncbi:MAG: antirestriction protein [Candidatus Glassbacteria bacterium]